MKEGERRGETLRGYLGGEGEGRHGERGLERLLLLRQGVVAAQAAHSDHRTSKQENYRGVELARGTRDAW